MNSTKTPTNDKTVLPLRLPPELYNKMRKKVNKKKDKVRGYSINEYLTELITKDLEVKKNG